MRKDKAHTYNFILGWGGKKEGNVFGVKGSSISPSELWCAINSMSVMCNACMQGTGNCLQHPLWGVTSPLWITTKSKVQY